MNELDPMEIVLSVVYPEHPNNIHVEEIVKNRDLLKAAIKLAKRNGLYYYFILKLKESNQNLSFSNKEQERWDGELQKLSALKKTFTFLNDMQTHHGIDYILIKACTKIPHVPRDVDILVRSEDRDKIYDLFEREGIQTIYSNPVETAFGKEGYIKLDIYSKIQYIGVDFIDSEFLWNSKVEDRMFGIEFPSLNDEANFLLLLVHSIFGHRSMTLLDFLHMKSLMSNIQDINMCREYAYEKSWGAVFNMGLERLESICKTIYKDGEIVSFPYLFDRKFMLKCIASIDGLEMKKCERVFFHISLGLKRLTCELVKSPFYDSLMTFNTGRKIFNSFAYFVGARCGNRHGIYGPRMISEGNMSHSNESNKPNVMVVTHPLTIISGTAKVTSFIDVLMPIFKEIFMITGNFSYESNKKIHIMCIKGVNQKESMLIWAFKQILIQLRICINLLKTYKNIDIVVFYLGGRTYLLPMLLAKLRRKKTIVTATGSASKTTKGVYSKFSIGKTVIPLIAGILEKANYSLADQVAVESEGAVDFLGLNKYRKKISIVGAVYIDTDNFKIKKDLKDKRNLIGYIGRLSSEKGVLNFAKAIPLILKERDDLDFLIGGNGQLFDEIKNELNNNGSYDKVELTGWITRDELSKYLNELKLIISPSYTEGGVPAVIMEAMACGTIVLVTPVAAADIIKDGESGFILEDNSPECIAKNVIRVLAHPNLDKIVKNASNLVEEEFSYEKVVKQYRDMLYKVLSDKK